MRIAQSLMKKTIQCNNRGIVCKLDGAQLLTFQCSAHSTSVILEDSSRQSFTMLCCMCAYMQMMSFTKNKTKKDKLINVSIDKEGQIQTEIKKKACNKYINNSLR